MRRRAFLRQSTLGAAAVFTPTLLGRAAKHSREAAHPGVKPFELDETDIPELQAGLTSGKFTAVGLVKKYTSRIEQIDRQGPAIRSVIELNPDAREIATRLDEERSAGTVRGPLHGIPVLIKDNIDTGDRMNTTAGSLALEGSPAPRDAFVVERLRRAGAVLLGKTNLSEWANFRGSRSTSGWSARGGQTLNPYVLDRNPSGSSSGSAAAVAASLCAVAVGTETDGSILSPASYNGIVGLKPTVGLVSRSGIIPISRSQDTAGPMGRTVKDVAILLGAMTGVDSGDAATEESREQVRRDYTSFLQVDGLRGARIGVARQYFRFPERVASIFSEAIAALESAGAELVDPVQAPGFSGFGSHESLVLQYEFKTGLNKYLAAREGARARTLKELIDFNERFRAQEMPWFGQEHFIQSEGRGPLTDQVYLDALEATRRLTRKEGIDAAMDEHRLDAIVVPSGGPAHVTDLLLGDGGMGSGYSVAAAAGYPSITIPAGNLHGLPVGIAFLGRAWSEPALLRIAHAFEQATRFRRPPRFRATITAT